MGKNNIIVEKLKSILEVPIMANQEIMPAFQFYMAKVLLLCLEIRKIDEPQKNILSLLDSAHKEFNAPDKSYARISSKPVYWGEIADISKLFSCLTDNDFQLVKDYVKLLLPFDHGPLESFFTEKFAVQPYSTFVSSYELKDPREALSTAKFAFYALHTFEHFGFYVTDNDPGAENVYNSAHEFYNQLGCKIRPGTLDDYAYDFSAVKDDQDYHVNISWAPVLMRYLVSVTFYGLDNSGRFPEGISLPKQ